MPENASMLSPSAAQQERISDGKFNPAVSGLNASFPSLFTIIAKPILVQSLNPLLRRRLDGLRLICLLHLLQPLFRRIRLLGVSRSRKLSATIDASRRTSHHFNIIPSRSEERR